MPEKHVLDCPQGELRVVVGRVQGQAALKALLRKNQTLPGMPMRAQQKGA